MTRLVSEITIPYVFVLGAYFEMDAFIASFYCVVNGCRDSWSRSRVMNSVHTFHISS